MKTSFTKLIAFDQASASYKARHPEESKFGYAVDKLGAKLLSISKKFNEALEETFGDIRLDHCLTDPPNDPNGKVLRDDQNRYLFTREGEKAYRREIKAARDKALGAEDIEITPYFATQIPDDLTDQELEAFSGFVIKADTVQSMLEARDSQDNAIDVSQVPQNGGQAMESLAG